MHPRRTFVFVMALMGLPACSSGTGDPTAPGVVVGSASLPPAGAAYRGAGPHLFLEGAARLTCGSHGGFTSAVEPPAAAGGTALSEYQATFVGELVLEPPLVSTAVTHSLVVVAHMVERVTLVELRGSTRVFDTELLALDLAGSGIPAAVLVRESPSKGSTGRTTVTALSGGQHRIESHYDVWLEISLDGGRSWQPAQGAVRMTLGASGSGTR